MNNPLDTILSKDLFSTIQTIESDEGPVAALKKYSEVISDLYKERHIASMVALGRAAIQYSIRECAQAEKSDADLCAKLKQKAKAIAYNVSANCWPGWDEPDVRITESDLVNGLDLARTNLRFAYELNSGPEIIGTGLWLVGAHEWALGRVSNAVRTFQTSAAEFKKANNSIAELMANGYAAAVGRVDPQTAAEGQKELDAVLDRFRDQSEGASFFAKQIETAVNFFLKSSRS